MPSLLNNALEFPLVIGRLLRCLRGEAGISQRAFADELGVGHGTLAWLEAGRSNPYAAPVFIIEAGLIRHGVLCRSGQVFELLSLLLVELAHREVRLTSGTVPSLSGRDDVAPLDRIAGTVVQRFLDRKRQQHDALDEGDRQALESMLEAGLAGPVTKRKSKPKRPRRE